MISFWRIIWLELLSLIRSRAVLMLSIISAVWMFLFPCFVRSDGTTEGAWQLDVQYSLGGVFILLVVTLLASATGAVARERTAKRLQLTLVRPVRYCLIALGKIVAHVAVGAFVLAVAAAILFSRADHARRCNHVLSPILPSVQEEAQTMYEAYMKDPSTPDHVRKAKKENVIRLLTLRAIDRYESIPTNATVSWSFHLPSFHLPKLENKLNATNLSPVNLPSPLSVRLRFTNAMEVRQDLRGIFRLKELTAVVSNKTQAVLEVPLKGLADEIAGRTELSFTNHGETGLMLRPRRDLHVLVPADTFGRNLLRAYAGMIAVLALIISVGIFLSSALGRPVAIFVAFITLILGEMSPSVIAAYPDTLDTNSLDRIGLVMTRFVTEVTRPVSSLQPLSALAADECVEIPEVVRTVCLDLIVFPIAFSLLAAFVLPRKQDDLI